jgi:putative oxygen-independent coproporphyrinogen III oxidase
MSLLAPGIPLSLYVHIPWCVQKCPYCDFNSHQADNQLDEQGYINALIEDLQADLPRIWGRGIDSIFIGGGTPSLFSGQAIDNLMSQLRALLMLKADLEVTLESNPGTFDANNYRAYRQSGINRLSIGAQSFDPKQLKTLGRIHSQEQISEAFHQARAAGFKRINIDLMYGLPNQSVEQALADLKAAIELEPEHISWYQLTIEPNTAFYSYPPDELPDNDRLFEIQEAGAELLRSHGFSQYEVSAWCLPGEESKHNLNYWQFGDYLGIGAGAHGKITDLQSESIYRTRRRKQPSHYLSNPIKIAQDSSINSADLPLEFMMNALRLIEGVPSSYFVERTGLSLQLINKALTKAHELGLMEKDFHQLKPTEKGINYHNDLLELFMPSEVTDTSNSISVKQISS